MQGSVWESSGMEVVLSKNNRFNSATAALCIRSRVQTKPTCPHCSCCIGIVCGPSQLLRPQRRQMRVRVGESVCAPGSPCRGCLWALQRGLLLLRLMMVRVMMLLLELLLLILFLLLLLIMLLSLQLLVGLSRLCHVHSDACPNHFSFLCSNSSSYSYS